MAITIALAGNPNAGKTTLFNQLTGSNQYVGNWPGVTVEKKEGKLKGHKDVVIADLPGIYSLSPYTLEEVVARNYLINNRPDAILNIVDGTNLERNLYLSTQLKELGIPVVMAINMMDVVEKNGDVLNLEELGKAMGCKVVSISALRNKGVAEASALAVAEANAKNDTVVQHKFSEQVEGAINSIENLLEGNVPESQKRFFAIKLFERDDKIRNEMPEKAKNLDVESIIAAVEKAEDDDSESIITNERYNYIQSIIEAAYVKRAQKGLTVSDKIDAIVTNRFLAIPIFAAAMFLVYYISISTVGTAMTDWVNDVLFGSDPWSFFGLVEVPSIPGIATSALEAMQVSEAIQGLVVDGIIAGLGAVIGFLPQMLTFFFFLAFLEGCGYMARVAFIMDRIFRKFGLSGKSFIPILIGTGCGVPGVMASRTVENERDRRMTIMTTTFIPCSAKLPVIALLAGAMFDGSAWVGWSTYFLGISAIVFSGIVLKKTKMFAGKPAPFVMELPAYHWPRLIDILKSVGERGMSFVKKAGTVILLATILVWFLSRFNFSLQYLPEEDMDSSILAAFGNTLTWLFAPLGWGKWKAVVAALTGLIAKENVVGTFGTLFHYAGAEALADSGDQIWPQVKEYFASGIVGYSFLAFNLLCAPCFAAIGAIKREMNNGRWTIFAVAWECFLAYCVSLVIYQVGGLVTGEVSFNPFTIVAFILILVGLWGLFRPYKEAETLSDSDELAVEKAMA
ncbi:ferrous iron transport protein B [Oribacterium sinus]|uniref:ferrous iron transport protein B n=1 Tax=Oribacterium sinus TaxID=237576 RepID=UPI0028D664D3|nr:ferrous iron transport protein B [Oribacterium sinus]